MADSSSSARSTAARHHLARRLTDAVAGLEDPATPLVLVDLDAFEANADDLARRATGTPIRVASKSLRVPALIERALAHPGFSGVLAYTLREALWLADHQISDDVVLGYPSVDRVALRRLLADEQALATITLMVDDPVHLDLVDEQRRGVAGASTSTADLPVRVAIDVDAGLRLGRSHVGPKRSPLHDPAEVVRFARHVLARPGFRLVGVMTYEGQVAGVPDAVPRQRAKSMVVRRLKSASMTQLAERRGVIARELSAVVDLEFWNGGGSGSVEATAADAAVTEVAAGSGLLVPTLFDHYQSFDPRPAAFFGVPVVRRPSDGIVTVAGGGFVASGPTGKDRAPTPWAPPGLHLTGLEGAGEVQTPLTGPMAAELSVGDWVWFRHAKSGELAEHTNVVHLVAGDRVVDTVPSYRGLGCAW
jgi:D-serine deaminase-like pyridoxal phosphate-dependent protein